MQLINTGKYILKFYFSDPTSSPSWVLKTFTYMDQLQDNHKQSLIDIHFKNDGADVPLAFINLAKLGLKGMMDRHKNSEAPQKLEGLEEEFDTLKIKIEEFIKDNNFGSERIEYYHQELNQFEKELSVFIKKTHQSKSFFPRSKSKDSPTQSPAQEFPAATKQKSKFKYLIFIVMVLTAIVFYAPISTFFWKIGLPSNFDGFSNKMKITRHVVENRNLTIYIPNTEIKSVGYKQLKPMFETMMNKAFDMGFENFMIKDLKDQIVAKNVLLDNKNAIYVFYYEEEETK